MLSVSFATASHAKESAAVAKHIILVIGDGMEPENEIAASRYLTGTDDGLAFHAFPYRGLVATWDVNTYNRQASRYGAKPFNPSAIIPRAGCDAAQYGKPRRLPERGAPLCLPRARRRKAPCRRFSLDSHGLGHATRPIRATSPGFQATRTGGPEDDCRTVAGEARILIGIVTTVPFSDATPAAFVSQTRSRRNLQPSLTRSSALPCPKLSSAGGTPPETGPGTCRWPCTMR